jgi:hypothetical protein
MAYWLLAIAAFAATALWISRRSQQRSSQIAGIAQELNFRSLGERLPADINLSPSFLSSVSSVGNVIDDARSGVRIVAFDCRVGQGKNSWQTTVIAVKAEPSRVKAGNFDINLEKEHIDGWMLLFHGREMDFSSECEMSSEELRGYLEAI